MTLEDIQKNYKGRIPRPIVDIAHDLNIVIRQTDEFDDSISGSLSKEQDSYVIYVNANHAPVRKRFTIAHEIGHFLKHKSIFDSQDEHIDSVKQPVSHSLPHTKLFRQEEAELSPEQKAQEIEANAIAAELLMPVEEFKKAWAATENIEDIAAAFEVSVSAATLRAKELFGATII